MDLVAPILALLVCLLFWSRYWRQRTRLWRMAQDLPGPKPYPFIGNCLLLRHTNMSVNLEVMSGLVKEFGPVVKIWFGDKLNVLLVHPDDIQQVLGNPRIRNRDCRISLAATTFLGKGLFTSRDEEWKQCRKASTPLFHFEILQAYMKIFGETSLILVEQLNKVADETCIDIHKYLSLCTLDAICATALGSSIDLQREGCSELQFQIEKTTNLIYDRICLLSVLPEWSSGLVYNGPETRNTIKSLRSICSKLIGKKFEEYEDGVRHCSFVTTSGTSIRSSIDMLIEASDARGYTLSEQDMQDEIITLAGAGMETTAATMSFSLLLLAIHPDIQDQLSEELDAIFGDDARTATSEDIPRMRLLDRVIKETLRHFPIGTFLGREIGEDVHLPRGHLLPKGCTVMIPSYLVHMNEEFYRQPDKFWPDRWLAENDPPRHPYAYLPFSAGPRNCVGQKYATLQMKTVLSTLLRRYRVTTDYTMQQLKEQELTALMTLAGTDKYQLRLTQR